jgi:hypothetical protein
MVGTSDPGYTPAEAVPIHGVIGDHVFFDPNTATLFGNLKVWSSSLPEAFEAGKDDLSLGYHCVYIPEPGIAPDGTPYDYIQRRMRGNHVADVWNGRCGDEVSVLDCRDVLTFDSKDFVMVESLRKRNPKAFNAAVKKVVGTYAGKYAVAGRKLRGVKLANYAMDADDDTAVASEPTLGDVADMLADVLPQIADINAAMSGAAPDDTDGAEDDDMEMEPEMDEAGEPVMDAAGKPKMKPVIDPATGKPKMKAKAPPAAPAMDRAAMDAAIANAVRLAVAPLKAKLDALPAGGVKGVLASIAQRDALASKLAPFIGTFDYAEMTLQEVAKYGAKKLEIPAMDGQEVSAITAYLHNRPAPAARTFTVPGMDAAPAGGKSLISDWLNGKAA